MGTTNKQHYGNSELTMINGAAVSNKLLKIKGDVKTP